MGLFERGPQGPAGPPGKTGKQFLSGSGAPDSSLGNDGDHYLDKAAGQLYGAKANGAWGDPIALSGGGTSPKTFAELFGADLVHFWGDDYDAETGAWPDDAGSADAEVDTFEIPTGVPVNGHDSPKFNGVDQALTAGVITDLDGLTTYTLAGCFNAGLLPSGAVFEQALQFGIEFTITNKLIVVINGSDTIQSTTSINDNGWHRFVLTVSAGAASLYLDGVLEATATFDDPIDESSTNECRFGIRYDDEFMAGRAAACLIATSGLTSTEAGQLDALLVAWLASAAAIPLEDGLTPERGVDETYDTDSIQLGRSISLPDDADTIVDAEVQAIYPGASKTKTFNLRRGFLNTGAGVTPDASTENMTGPKERGGTSPVTATIEYTGETARVEVGGAAVRWHFDIQVNRRAAGPFVGSPPTVTSMLHGVGDIDGGWTDVITGTGFTGATDVSVGGVSVNAFTVDSDTQITITDGCAHAAAANQSVVVTNGAGANGANTLFEFWSPAQLTASLFFDRVKGPYVLGTWPGVASAGSSAGRDLTSAGGFRPTVSSGEPDFDGTDDFLANTTAMSSIFSATGDAGTCLVIFDADTAVASAGTIGDAGLFIDTSTYMGLTFTSTGVRGWLLDGTRKTVGPVAAATGQRHAASFRWGTGGGGQLELRVDATTATPVACGTMDVMTGQITVGKNYDSSKFVDGRIRTIVTMPSTISNADQTLFHKWARSSRGAV